jgi:all-beta uncharacterized protein/BACON domain-containing protein
MVRFIPVILAAVFLSACGSTSTESVTGPSAPKCLVSLAGPAGAIGASGGTGAVTVTTQPECEWTAAAEAAWITELAPVSGQGNGQVQFQVVPNPNGTTRESAVSINGQRALVRQDASPCEITVTITANQFPSSGGTGAIAIAAPSGCAWTASSNVGWIAPAPLFGSGSGSISFTVAVNTGAERTGTITAGGVAITISQAATGTAPPPVSCTISLQPLSASIPASGGPGTVGITTNPGCPWAANSTVAWITLTTAVSGSGNGSVGFNVAANTATTGRVGSISVSGATFTVNQSGSSGSTCTISINPTSQSVPAAGATGINVAVSTATGCAWTTTSNAAWITVTAGSSGSGNGTVTLNAAANTGTLRTGTATIGGQTFTVNQAAAPCTYSINPSSQSIGAAGGSGTAAVSTSSGCTWSASSNAPWLTITSGASGSGGGNVNFTIAANTGVARTGTLTIAGQTFTVNQAAAGPCTYSINPTTITVGDEPVSGLSVAVAAGAGCTWNATPNAGWLQITAGSSGTGNGSVTYTVADYTGSLRTGTMTIAGQTFTVTQVRCSATLNPQTQAVGVLGGSFTVAVTTQIGCPWQAVESLSWVTITSGSSGTGSGTVGYTVAPNIAGARSGPIAIAGETLTINQAAVLP